MSSFLSARIGIALLALLAFMPRIIAAQPNIIFILADDLGYGDVGAFGQHKIRTPTLDRLAAEGMRLTQHYSGNAVCAPSRCVLLTGLHPGHAQIRNNREIQPEGQWPLAADTVTLPRLLQQAGYVTGAFGKWGLGPPGSTGDPLRQGFNRFYGYNCQRVAHNYYPTFLWSDSERVPLGNPEFRPYQRLPADADPADPSSYASYSGTQYAPDLMTDQALEFIRTHRDRPFFLYYPTTVPHLALQVPADSLDEYEDAFPDQPYLGGSNYLPHRTPRAAYAAMITRLDREIGRMVNLVKDLGLEERTLWIFSSDNGPLSQGAGGTDSEFFDSAGGLRGRKGSLYEGGIRVPCIVRWPGHVPAGTQSDRVTGFEDWMPTLLELAGGTHLLPGTTDGISFARTLTGDRQPERRLLYREFPGYGGWQSLRVGDWKLVRHSLMPGKGRGLNPAVELYHLGNDPAEQHDLAADNTRRVTRMLRRMARQRVSSVDFPFPALDGTAP
jgi:arylsulfatase